MLTSLIFKKDILEGECNLEITTKNGENLTLKKVAIIYEYFLYFPEVIYQNDKYVGIWYRDLILLLGKQMKILEIPKDQIKLLRKLGTLVLNVLNKIKSIQFLLPKYSVTLEKPKSLKITPKLEVMDDPLLPQGPSIYSIIVKSVLSLLKETNIDPYIWLGKYEVFTLNQEYYLSLTFEDFLSELEKGVRI